MHIYMHIYACMCVLAWCVHITHLYGAHSHSPSSLLHKHIYMHSKKRGERREPSERREGQQRHAGTQARAVNVRAEYPV